MGGYADVGGGYVINCMSCVKVAQKLLPLLGQYCGLIFGVVELDGRGS